MSPIGFTDWGLPFPTEWLNVTKSNFVSMDEKEIVSVGSCMPGNLFGRNFLKFKEIWLFGTWKHVTSCMKFDLLPRKLTFSVGSFVMSSKGLIISHS